MKISKKHDLKTNMEVAAYGKFADSRALAAWRWFRTCQHAASIMGSCGIALPPEVLQHARTENRLDALKSHEKAMMEMDASFFRQLAEFFDFMSGQTKPRLIAWHTFGKYIYREQRKIEQGKRNAITNPIRRQEVFEHLASTVPGGISERNFATIYKEFGILLAKTKPGPKVRRKMRK